MLNPSEARAKRKHATRGRRHTRRGHQLLHVTTAGVTEPLGQCDPAAAESMRRRPCGAATQPGSVAALVAKGRTTARLTRPGSVGFALEATPAGRFAVGPICTR